MKKENKVENEQVNPKVAEQKQVFEAIAKYRGKKVEYNPALFEDLNRFFEGILFACEAVTLKAKLRKKYGLENKEGE